MIKRAFLTLIMVFQTGLCCSQTDKEILNKIISNLKALKTVEYNYSFCQNYHGLQDTQNDFCFFDFSSPDTIMGAKYQFVGKYGEQVFNGMQTFSSRNDLKTVLYSNQPNKQSVSCSFYSIYVLRKLLPEIITDISIKIIRQKDTLLNANDCYKFRISIPGRLIDSQTSTLETGQTGILYCYFLSIAKKDYLPVQVQYMFQRNDGFITTTFDHINTAAVRNDSTWSYERFPKNYRRLSTWEAYNESLKPKEEIVILDKQTSDWTLPLVGGDSIKISNLKGKLVLLDFWFVGCVACAKAIPEVNEIMLKYIKKGLIVYGIEFMKDNDSRLLAYIKKSKIEYKNLYKGSKIYIEYGLKAAPSYILIDKTGKVVYMRTGMNKEELIAAIDRNI